MSSKDALRTAWLPPLLIWALQEFQYIRLSKVHATYFQIKSRFKTRFFIYRCLDFSSISTELCIPMLKTIQYTNHHNHYNAYMFFYISEIEHDIAQQDNKF